MVYRFFSKSGPNWKGQYGNWLNVASREIFISYTPDKNDQNWKDSGFDPTEIVSFGLKFGAAGSGNKRYTGEIKITGLDISPIDESIEVPEIITDSVWAVSPANVSPVSVSGFQELSGVALYDKYGHDVGGNKGWSTRIQELTAKFTEWKAKGVNVVRIFTLCDLRNDAITFDSNGKPTGYSEKTVDDLFALIKAADRAGVKVMPVLFDFHLANGVSEENGNPVGEHANLFSNSEHKEALLEIFEEILTKLKSKMDSEGVNDGLLAFEPLNEPGLIILPQGNEMAYTQEFVDDFVGLFRKVFPDKPISLSVRSANNFENLKYWLPLLKKGDILNIHWYPEVGNRFGDLETNIGKLNIPDGVIVMIGEASSNDGIEKVLDKAHKSGFKGLLFWSDSHYRLFDHIDQFDKWFETNKTDASSSPKTEDKKTSQKQEAPSNQDFVEIPADRFITQNQYSDIFADLQGMGLKLSEVGTVVAEFTTEVSVQPMLKAGDNWQNFHAESYFTGKKIVWDIYSGSIYIESGINDDIKGISFKLNYGDLDAALKSLKSVKIYERSDSGLIGKLYDDNKKLITGGVNVTLDGKEVKVSHPKRSEDITLEVKNSQLAPSGIINSLKELLERKTPSTLTEKETENLGNLMKKVASVKKVVAVKSYINEGEGESFSGYLDKENGILYLDENIIDEPMAILHELGEAFIEVPEDYSDKLTKHTFMRGVGKDVRSAYEELDKDKVESMKMDAFIRELNNKIIGRDLTDSERLLIAYNFMQERRGIESLYGMQDHLDPFENMSFTQKWEDIKKDVRCRGLNIHIIRASNLETKAKQMKIAKEASRKLDMNGKLKQIVIHHNGTDAGLERALELAHEEASRQDNWDLVPQISVNCNNEDNIKIVDWFLDNITTNYSKEDADMFIKLYDQIPLSKMSIDEAMIEEAKVIAVGDILCNDKRIKMEGSLPGEMKDMRIRYLSFFESCGFLEISNLEGMSADDLECLVNKLLRGKEAFRITKIKWERVKDWYESQKQVLLSL